MEEAELDRTEQATPFKLRRAKEKGTVARGLDLGFFAAIAAATCLLWIGGSALARTSAHAFAEVLAAAGAIGASPQAIPALASRLALPLTTPLAVFAGAVFFLALALDFAQVGPVFSTTPLKPDFARINPAKGLKRLLSWRLLVEAAKALIKLAVYATIAWLVIDGMLGVLAAGSGGGLRLASALLDTSLRLLAYFALAALGFALVDQIYVRRDFAKRMRMSRRELKREQRDREGEPRIKQKRKQLHNAFAKAVRALRNVPRSDVVITNPTHYAVALRFDAVRDAAPVIVARGAGELSLRIRRIGLAHGVVTVVDPPLARALYRRGRLDCEIPGDFYRAVADHYRRHGLGRRATA